MMMVFVDHVIPVIVVMVVLVVVAVTLIVGVSAAVLPCDGRGRLPIRVMAMIVVHTRLTLLAS